MHLRIYVRPPSLAYVPTLLYAVVSIYVSTCMIPGPSIANPFRFASITSYLFMYVRRPHLYCRPYSFQCSLSYPRISVRPFSFPPVRLYVPLLFISTHICTSLPRCLYPLPLCYSLVLAASLHIWIKSNDTLAGLVPASCPGFPFLIMRKSFLPIAQRPQPNDLLATLGLLHFLFNEMFS